MKYKSKFFMLLILVIAFLIIALPEISKLGVTRGIIISANVLIPSLFPFMVCVLMLINSDIYINNRLINLLLYKFFGHSFNMFFIFILSMIGGYPVGAKLVNELHNRNEITDNTANLMLMYCVNAGPSFIVFVVGSYINSIKIGIVLLVSHIFSSIIIALLCSKSMKRNFIKQNHRILLSKNFSNIFTKSVLDASESIMQICSFVVMFSAINSYLEYFLKNIPILKYVVFFTEISSSIANCKNIFFISFLLSFSGLSIWCQIFAITTKIKLNKIRFILSRFLHGLLSVIITRVLLSTFNTNISTFSNTKNINYQIFYSNSLLFGSMAIMIITFLINIYSKNNSRKIINDVL